MTTQNERDLRARLIDREVRLALADLPEIAPKARRDVARRLIEMGADARPDGTIIMATGGSIADGLASIRADGGEHLFTDYVELAAVIKPDLTGLTLTPTRKLSACNGGDL